MWKLFCPAISNGLRAKFRTSCSTSYFHRPPICILTVSTLFEIKTHALQRKNLYFRWLLSTKCSPGPSHSSLVFDHRPDPRCGGPFPRMRPCKPSQLLSLTESFQIARLFGSKPPTSGQYPSVGRQSAWK